MKKYFVYLTRLEYGSVEVEAENDEEAKIKAREAYEKGEASWHDEELTDITPEEE